MKMMVNEDADRYLHGECHVMAIALHRITGRPMRAALAYDPSIKRMALVHCWITIAGDEVMDASGVTTTAWSLQRYPDGDEAELVELDCPALLKLGEGTARRSADLERRIEEATPFARALLQDEEVVEAFQALAAADPTTN